MGADEKLVDISRVSKTKTSLRVTLPKDIAEKISINEGEFLGFYMIADTIYIRKVK